MTVVIVEDHPFAIDFLRRHLERSGLFAVVGVAEPEDEAVETIHAQRPDVAIIDLQLSAGGDGLTVARSARKISARTKLIVLTASEDPRPLRDLFSVPVEAYLSKNLETADMIRAIECVCSGLCVYTKEAAATMLDEKPAPPCTLTEGQLQLLAAASRGWTYKELSIQLHLGESTIRRDLEQIQEQLGVSNRIEAIALASSRGWIRPSNN